MRSVTSMAILRGLHVLAGPLPAGACTTNEGPPANFCWGGISGNNRWVCCQQVGAQDTSLPHPSAGQPGDEPGERSTQCNQQTRVHTLSFRLRVVHNFQLSRAFVTNCTHTDPSGWDRPPCCGSSCRAEPAASAGDDPHWHHRSTPPTNPRSRAASLPCAACIAAMKVALCPHATAAGQRAGRSEADGVHAVHQAAQRRPCPTPTLPTSRSFQRAARCSCGRGALKLPTRVTRSPPSKDPWATHPERGRARMLAQRACCLVCE